MPVAGWHFFLLSSLLVGLPGQMRNTSSLDICLRRCWERLVCSPSLLLAGCWQLDRFSHAHHWVGAHCVVPGSCEIRAIVANAVAGAAIWFASGRRLGMGLRAVRYDRRYSHGLSQLSRPTW